MLVSIYTFFLALRCVGGMLDGLTSLYFGCLFDYAPKILSEKWRVFISEYLATPKTYNCILYFDCLVFTTTLL